MKIITHKNINDLNISCDCWFRWVDEAIRNKSNYIMPAKKSIHFGESYFNSMPCVLPSKNVMGIKCVNRYINREPSLESQILLYNYTNGQNLALIDGSMITTMRTAASAIHSVKLFANTSFKNVAIMGLGNIGVAVIKMICAMFSKETIRIKLLRYKDHENRVKNLINNTNNIDFQIVDSEEELIKNSDVIISCITYTDNLIGRNEWFKKGCLVIPVHLRGFQNCDVYFDKVFGDSYSQVKGFKYFNQFKSFAETTEVVNGERPGRESDDERIIVYNVGMAINDIYAASEIFDLIENNETEIYEIDCIGPQDNYWI